MTEAETITTVCNLLHELGYKAEIFDDETVGSAASGLKFIIQSYGSSIQFRCSVALERETEDRLKLSNDFNTKIRFVKLYADSDSAVLLEADWWFDPDDVNQANCFRNAMDLWELALAAFKDKLRELSSPSSSEVA